MGHDDIGVGLSEMASDLQEAADIAAEDGLSFCGKDVVLFSFAELVGHFGLGQVVAAGGAAADFAFWQRDKLQFRNQLQKLSWRRANLLGMAEMAGVVVGRSHRQGMLRANGSQFDQEFRNVFDFVSEGFSQFCRGRAVQQMPVVFEHGAATGSVDDDRIDGTGSKKMAIFLGESLGRLLLACMVMKSAAADLRTGYPNVAAVFLQNAGRRPIGLRKDGVRDAAGEKSDAGSPLSFGG